MKLYLGRMLDGDYELSFQKAGFDKTEGWEPCEGYLTGFCGEDFHKYTKRTKPFKKGQVREVKSIVITLE